jgi:hypothetical protein
MLKAADQRQANCMRLTDHNLASYAVLANVVVSI